MSDQPDGMDLPPLNEWVVDEMVRTKEALTDLISRHQSLLDYLSALARKNDALRAAGRELKAIIHEGYVLTTNDGLIERIDRALERWENIDV